MARRSNRKSKLPPGWAVHGNPHKAEGVAMKGAPAWGYAATGLGLGGLIGLAIFLWPGGNVLEARDGTSAAAPQVQRSFSLCYAGGGTNCVVDGDTIWMDHVKIRVADIDAPETHPPRCDREADLGNRATQRLLALVNEGPVEAVPSGDRDTDRYGRKLRVLMRNGHSLGEQLVQEGLARRWDGARHPWCPLGRND